MVRQKLLLGAVALHLVLTTSHGLVHAVIPVILTGWVAAAATISVYLLPIAGAGLVVRDHHRIGSLALVTAGIAGVVFEGTLHFLVSNPDHIAQIPAHRGWFSATAILTTFGNLILIWAAWLAVRGNSLTDVQGRVMENLRHRTR